MITKEQYFMQTEHAARALFNCVSEYNGVYRRSIPPFEAISHDSKGVSLNKQHQEWRNRPEIIEQHDIADKAEQKFEALIFSMHVISGAILQLACKAIDMYSKNSYIEDKYHFVFDGCNENIKKINTKFFIGREVCGMPIGLVILAGRNQYNHIEAGSNLNILNKNIFQKIAVKDDYIDPAFDLNCEGIDSYSSNMRSLIGWDTYDKYYQDMVLMLEDKI